MTKKKQYRNSVVVGIIILIFVVGITKQVFQENKRVVKTFDLCDDIPQDMPIELADVYREMYGDLDCIPTAEGIKGVIIGGDEYPCGVTDGICPPDYAGCQQCQRPDPDCEESIYCDFTNGS